MPMHGCSIVVAETLSSNGYSYSDAALQAMADQMVGKPIFKTEPDGSDEKDAMENVCGIANRAGLVEGKVIAPVAWFSEEDIPFGKFLTPTGHGTLKEGVLVDYTLEHLTVSESSAFASAERVPPRIL